MVFNVDEQKNLMALDGPYAIELNNLQYATHYVIAQDEVANIVKLSYINGVIKLSNYLYCIISATCQQLMSCDVFQPR